MTLNRPRLHKPLNRVLEEFSMTTDNEITELIKIGASYQEFLEKLAKYQLELWL